ncbi:MAG: hypothetical protein MZV70_13895 [Desulfobacterales bacterium]|nr:hypothetical protein [Desulfobacterales bacterium]
MAVSRGLLSAMARDAARRQRQAESEMRRRERERKRAIRQERSLSGQQARDAKQAYIEGRIEETGELNEDLQEAIEAISGVLKHTLSVDDTIAFDSLRIHETFPNFALPDDFPKQPETGTGIFFNQGQETLGRLYAHFIGQGKVRERTIEAEKDYQSAVERCKENLTQWNQKKDELYATYEKEGRVHRKGNTT